jgi:alkanesulfonate monooxygenase SsuD/methylene tetrahydromethanopterin reductase-like flavin-dependent oxidoreductase (luciferase family)
MKLSVGMGPLGPPGGESIIAHAQEAENLGYSCVWAPEIYGHDCFTPLAWIAANTTKIQLGTSIMQISARTPASSAMHAVTLDYLSEGRFNLGTPLKLILHPVREEIPLYLGAEGPKNVALGAELCDGWIPMLISPYRMMDVYKDSLAHRPPDFDIVAGVSVIIDDDVKRGLESIRQHIGFYVGGMGAKSFNVHKDHVARQGFAEVADKIQDLFLAGKKDQAIAAVPDELCDEMALVGPRERIRDRLAAWKESPVTTINVGGNKEALQFMAEELL